MFDLEKSIADWRKQMLAAGIKTPVPLEELEIHLREETDRQVKSGLNEQNAFEISIQQIGQAGILKTEFGKAGVPISEKMKRFVFTLAGIPDYQFATNMNTNSNIEPRWATYLKTVAFIFPAAFFWLASCVFVLPKLKEVCATSGINIPQLITFALALSDLFRENLIVATLVILAALILLEWRCGWWQRRRRLFFGIGVFLVNSAVLIVITMMLVLAVGAAAHLHAK